MTRRWFKITFLVLVLAFLLANTVPQLLLLPILLLTGWVPSLGRLMRAWHASSGAVVAFGLATVVLVAGTHIFIRWLHGSWQKSASGTGMPTARWHWKWTLCGYGLALCVLLAIVSFVLTTHQLYWMSKSPEPWFVDKHGERLIVLKAAIDLQREAETNQWDSTGTRAAFWRMDSGKADQALGEVVRPVWIEKDGRTLQAIVLVPRKPTLHGTSRFAVLQPGTNYFLQDLDALPAVLASFGVGDAAQTKEGQGPLLP